MNFNNTCILTTSPSTVAWSSLPAQHRAPHVSNIDVHITAPVRMLNRLCFLMHRAACCCLTECTNFSQPLHKNYARQAEASPELQPATLLSARVRCPPA